MRIGEMLDARGDLEGAMKMYTEANNLEPSAELRRRMAAIDARLAYLKLPAEYRAIPNQPSITRGDLASLIGIRLCGAARSARPRSRSSSPTRATTGRRSGSWPRPAPG